MPDTMIILEDMESAFGRIRICESSRDGSRTYYQDSCSHSRVDRKGQSLVAYIHAMAGVLLQAKAHKILMLGCAGGSLATMLVAAGCEVTAVDINPYTFELAQRYFFLPPQVQCITADARTFLENTAERFDGIALDVFDGGEIPPHLRTVEFFRIVAARLAQGGVIVVNAIIDNDMDLLADHIAASMREAVGLPVAMLDDMQEPDRNIVIAAGQLPKIALPRGSEPLSVQKELRKMVVREPRRQAVAYYEVESVKAKTD